ncbi:hypothetical protein B7494_g5383 [Chlorociboria aeruginascens]|nr:hypothetical protein B7494_g5383 [Chlorociboria aeruginascens]
MNIFRIPILMERIIPSTLTGSINSTYAAGLNSIVDYITNTKGVYAIVDPHNYARYYGNVITDTAGFQTFWTTLASTFASNSKVIFDCNNEPHDMPTTTLTGSLMQACINGVRAAGATSQYIFVEGTSYTGAWTWTTSGNTDLLTLTDPQNKIVYEMHQYLDSDGSGTSATCVNSTIGSSRLIAATGWLQANNKTAILGEFAGGANSVCVSAIQDMLTYMGENTDTWLGGLFWGGGPWWGSYIYNMEPPSGVAYTGVLPSLSGYCRPRDIFLLPLPRQNGVVILIDAHAYKIYRVELLLDNHNLQIINPPNNSTNMASTGVVRVTMFKIPSKENQEKIMGNYKVLSATAVKDGKPYILSLQAGITHEDSRNQGYTVAAKTEFKNKEDMVYYDEQCEAHKALKVQSQDLGVEGIITVYYNPVVVAAL